MAQVVHKFPIPFASLDANNRVVINLPSSAEILSVQMQRDNLCIWSLVDDSRPAIYHRVIEVVGTGHPLSVVREGYGHHFLGTVQMENGALIFHVFEVK